MVCFIGTKVSEETPAQSSV